MQAIIQGRKSGRTSLLISLVAESEANGESCHIVVGSHEEASRLYQRAKEMGTPVRMPITYDDLLKGARSGADKLYLDNIEFLFGILSPIPVAAITMEAE